jgi:mono/diheme cytochrome c family protein
VKSFLRVLAGALAALMFGAGVPLLAGVQTSGRKSSEATTASTSGRDLFEFYCASCHGLDGKGNGRAATALKVPPPDLTMLAQRNHGTFPTEKVADLVKGSERLSTPAHGSRDMPVWGPIFKALDNRDEINAARIESIVRYIESIQAKAKA